MTVLSLSSLVAYTIKKATWNNTIRVNVPIINTSAFTPLYFIRLSKVKVPIKVENTKVQVR